MPRVHPAFLLTAGMICAGLASSAFAHPGAPGWGMGAWGERVAASNGFRSVSSREGKPEVATFLAEGDAARSLGKGIIAVVAAPGDLAVDERSGATFEAAIENKLAQAGYETAGAATSAQVAEVRLVRSEIEPAEPKHKPLSGEMTMGLSNHGSLIGLALRYDGSKPRGALVSTRLETRIRDRATGQVLWEGRAEILTRTGDERWTEQAVATRLATALFDRFPNGRS